MKKRFSMLLAAVFCAALLFAQSDTKNQKQPMLRHVVMFSFKSTASPADIRKTEEAFRALPAKITQIKGFEWGVNNSPEKLNQGLTHCFFLSFSSEKDRDAYLVHPDHKAFTVIAGPIIDKVTVLDYWTHQ
jgi:hypothetical protein